MPDISRRGRSIPESPIRKLVPFADEAKKKGHTVFHLNIGQPDIKTPPEFWQAIHEYPSQILAYGKSQGLDEYVEQLGKYYRGVGLDVTEHDILVTTGGSEAIVFAMMATTDPGDNIIVFEPFYTNYNGYAAMSDIELKPVTTEAETGYHLPDDDAILAQIDKRTKAILICTPNNPTGTILRRDEMERLAYIARENNLYLISDEVYREFTYEGEHTSVLAMPGLEDRAIIMDSISKRFSACGARIGSLVTKNRELWQTFLRLGQARLCPPSIEQHGAAAILRQMDANYFDDTVVEYKRRRDVVFEEIGKIEGAYCRKPSGAFYMMVTLPVKDVEDFAKWMLTDFEYQGKTTMFAPGPGFYATKGLGLSEIRIAYVLEEDKLRQAMEVLRIGLAKYLELKN